MGSVVRVATGDCRSRSRGRGVGVVGLDSKGDSRGVLMGSTLCAEGGTDTGLWGFPPLITTLHANIKIFVHFRPKGSPCEGTSENFLTFDVEGPR